MAKAKNLDNKKLELIQWVAESGEEYLIDEMLRLKNREAQDWWDDLSEHEKASIEAGQADIEAGRIIPHEEAKKVYEKWLTK